MDDAHDAHSLRGHGHQRHGRIIARWIITRKFLNKRPFLFTFVFMWGMGICSLLVGSIVVVLMSGPSSTPSAEIVGYKKGERYSTMMIIGCFLSAILFEGLLAFLNWLPAFCLTYQNMTGVGINYVTYFIIGFIVATLMIFLSVLAMKFIFRVRFPASSTTSTWRPSKARASAGSTSAISSIWSASASLWPT